MIDIKKERKAVGLTQLQIANRMGVSVRTIQDKEQGKGGSPTLSWLEKWSKAMDCKLLVKIEPV